MMVQGSWCLSLTCFSLQECPSEDGIKMVQGPKVSLTDLFLSAGVSKRGRAQDGPGPLVPLTDLFLSEGVSK
jgi:hypothetical protein